MNQKLPKSHILSSKKDISTLFTTGKTLKKFPMLLVYLPIEGLPQDFQVGFSVSKKRFKTAVDRNYIKRLMRESFRKKKPLFTPRSSQRFLYMFIFIGKQRPSLSQIEALMSQLAEKLAVKESFTPSTFHETL